MCCTRTLPVLFAFGRHKGALQGIIIATDVQTHRPFFKGCLSVCIGYMVASSSFMGSNKIGRIFGVVYEVNSRKYFITLLTQPNDKRNYQLCLCAPKISYRSAAGSERKLFNAPGREWKRTQQAEQRNSRKIFIAIATFNFYSLFTQLSFSLKFDKTPFD